MRNRNPHGSPSALDNDKLKNKRLHCELKDPIVHCGGHHLFGYASNFM